MRKLYKHLLIVGLILLMCCGVAGGLVYYRLNQNIIMNAPILLTVNKNQSVESVLDTLAQQDVLTPEFIMKPLFKAYLKISGKKMFAGSYKFEPIHTHLDVINALVNGMQNNMVKVTYPEGITVRDFARISAEKIGLDELEFLHFANSDSLRRARGIKSNNLDGYLFPATYIFFWKQTPEDVLNTLLDEQEKIWKTQFAEKAKIQGKSKQEVLTLASIVEAETPCIEERPRVAGVYQNRVRIGMRLEADPTVQYALGQKKRLTYDDLKTDNPYNTYRYAGLPPGPINNPSKSSISAALTPEKHNYIFFVAVGDGSGRHNFAVNFSAHKQYVSKYRQNVKKK